MAIPILWPSSDDVEDNCGSVDLLLEELLVTLRQILVQRRQERALNRVEYRQRTTVRHHQQTSSSDAALRSQTSVPTSPPTTVPSTPVLSHPRLPLPDLVPDNIDCDTPRPRKFSFDQSTPLTDDSVSTWVHAGAHLRNIADSFCAERSNDTPDGKRVRHKEANLFSLLCPDFGRSVWTTVALLVGWGIFSRSR